MLSQKEKSRFVAWFIIAQILDVVMTLIGVYKLGMKEINPLINFISLEKLILVKLFGISFSVYLIMKYINYKSVFQIVCGLSSAAVIWNTINIIVELVARS